jgi:hypothetical protein
MPTTLRSAHRGLALALAFALATPGAAVVLLAASSTACRADDGEDQSTDVAPPDLPSYDQPPIPGDGYAWTPGVWAWSDDDQDYYWVPGTWVLVPQPGYLWTPGFWSEETTVFFWHPGYWSAHVGFYGGICYGYGYCGHGFDGAYWKGGHLYYNRLAANLGSAPMAHVYSAPLPAYTGRASFNGANGGAVARADAAEQGAAHEVHLPPTSQQREHVNAARGEVGLRWSENQGVPPIAATARPADFSGTGVVAAKRTALSLSTDDVSRATRSPRTRRTSDSQEPSGAEAPSGARAPGSGRPPDRSRPSPDPRPPGEARPAAEARPPGEARPAGEPRTPARPAERSPAERPSPEHPSFRGR